MPAPPPMTLRPDRTRACVFVRASFVLPKRLQGLQAYTVLVCANNVVRDIIIMPPIGMLLVGVDFLIVAWAIFIAVKPMNRLCIFRVKSQA